MGASVSSSTKLIVLTVVAVLLPTTVLSVLQYRSLLQLEAKTKVAVQENLRQTLQAVVARVEDRVKSIAADSLLPFRAEEVQTDELDKVRQRFAEARRLHPELDEMFVFSLCSCRGDPFAIISEPEGPRHIHCSRWDSNREISRALEAFRGARFQPGSRDFTFFQSAETGAGPSSLYIFRILSAETKDRNQSTFAGLKLRRDYLVGGLLHDVTADLGRSSGADLAFGVLEDGQREIYGRGRYEMKIGFGLMFPQWELAVGYRNTTIDALARQQFLKNLLLTGLVVCCLAVGIVLTLRATAREARLAQLKSTFVSNVSHEMKTPLALIRLFAETLELGRVKSAEKVQEYYRIIHNESRRLTQLIDNVLDFAKVEAGRKEYQFGLADVGELVEGAVRSYEYQIVAAGFDLKVEIEPHLPPCQVDAAAFSQAFLNLLNNAVKYSPDEKRIVVAVGRRGGHVAVEVTDHGIGIPAAEHQRIFEKFYRVSNGLVHNTRGSGLGLALARHIVEAHGGRIVVESAPDKGSRFTILAPIPAPAASPGKKEWKLGGEAVAESVDRRG